MHGFTISREEIASPKHGIRADGCGCPMDALQISSIDNVAWCCSTGVTFHIILQRDVFLSHQPTPVFSIYQYFIFISFSRCICDGRETSLSKIILRCHIISGSGEKVFGLQYGYLEILSSVYRNYSAFVRLRSLISFSKNKSHQTLVIGVCWGSLKGRKLLLQSTETMYSKLMRKTTCRLAIPRL